MTEQEWLEAGDPERMLTFLRETKKLTARKTRLLACAAVRRVWHLLSHDDSKQAIETAEKFADGLRSEADITMANRLAKKGAQQQSSVSWFAALAVQMTTANRVPLVSVFRYTPVPHSLTGYDGARKKSQSQLLRDMMGPTPFRKVRIAEACLSWRDSTIPNVARSAYQERSLPSGQLDNHRLAVLSDALEESGLTNEEILTHLRSPGPHYRGCWCLDLVLRLK